MRGHLTHARYSHGAGWLIEPIIRSLARDSLVRHAPGDAGVTSVGRTPRSAADPLVGQFNCENSAVFGELLRYGVYQRRLPHLYENAAARLPYLASLRQLAAQPCLPHGRAQLRTAFHAMDRLAGRNPHGAFYLRQPAVADMIVEAIQYNASILGHYVLHAFVVMPNHVIC